MEIQLCTPQTTYFIVERVYTMYTTHTPGPQWRKVTRHVAQTCNVEDMYYDGQRVEGIPSTWQYLMDAIGLSEITTRPTGQTNLVLVYAGFEDFVRPLPSDLHVPQLPEFPFREYRLPQVSPFVYGTDPLPNVRLANDPSISFVAPGGDGPPTAMAVYHGDTQRLEPVPREQLEAVLRQMNLR